MEDMTIDIPGFGPVEGKMPIIILGPNGSGKTRLAQQIARERDVTPISAQRRTWPSDGLPVQEQHQLRQQLRHSEEAWKNQSWQPTDEIDYALSSLTQEHQRRLNDRNEESIESGKSYDPVTDTMLIRLQSLWRSLFPMRKLEIGAYYPKSKRLDAIDSPTYTLKEMSDGERTVLYMVARILVAETRFILVDEPELHMHSKLAIDFWDEAQRLRSDCRFIYITHDLNFALSRRDAVALVFRASDKLEKISITDLPASVATEVLGAATLPFYAKRIIFYEGEPGKGFASDFLSVWFDDPKTFAFPCGNRDAVCAAVKGLKNVGIVGAEVTGLVDRDFHPDSMLDADVEGVTVLDLHELESILCDKHVVAHLARHLQKDPEEVWGTFHSEVQPMFHGKELSYVVANRVRERIGSLLNDVFSRGLLASTLEETGARYSNAIEEIGLPTRVQELFDQESTRVNDSLRSGERDMLRLLPGKQLLDRLAKSLGLSSSRALTELVIKALSQRHLSEDRAGDSLSKSLEAALGEFLPPRRSG